MALRSYLCVPESVQHVYTKCILDKVFSAKILRKYVYMFVNLQ